MRRTAITRLSVTVDQRNLLEQTITEWRRGCQLATDMAWEQCNTKADVQPLAYDRIREQTDLASQHAVLATHQAAEAITGCIERRARGLNASKPTFTARTVTYDSRTMTVFDDETVSLTTTQNRVRCPLVLPTEDDGYQRQYLDADEWELTESTLTIRDGEVFLHIGFRRHKTATERIPAEDGTVLGVDLGIENLAVTSTAFFFDGRALTHRLREFQRTRGGLQQTGTRSAHRTLVGAAKRETRYIRDVLHRASNALVREALWYDCNVIAFENLTNIRKDTRAAWGHMWAFRTLYEQVAYKAEVYGIAVEHVPPHETSIECAECGYTARENRPARSVFCCQECGSRANADYNAAKNIGLRYVRRGQQSSRRTGDSQLALKSGTVTPNGGFTAYPAGFEAEFMDKPHPLRAKSSN